MKKKLILISGTPASGKDSVTNTLVDNDEKYTTFKKHKSQETGRVDETYIFVSSSKFDSMVENNQFVQYHYRYGRGYGVSKDELERLWMLSKTPVIHVGKYENIQDFYNLNNVEIISILLLTSKSETEKRLILRHKDDHDEIQARLKAYQEERNELSDLIRDSQDIKFDFVINNTNKTIENTAKIIQKLVEN